MTEEEADQSNLLKPFFIAVNIVAYLSQIFISIICKFVFLLTCDCLDGNVLYFYNIETLKAISGLLGVIYLIFCICMINYGLRLFLILRSTIEHADIEEREQLRPLLKRVL